MTPREIAVARKKVLEATKEAVKLNRPASRKKLSAHAEKVFAVILANDFGCKREQVAKLMSAVLEEEILMDSTVERVKSVMWAAFVPLKGHTDGHNYPLNRPFITNTRETYLTNSGYVRVDGISGNHITGDPRYFRPATPAEIAKIPKFQLEVAFKSAVFL